MLKNLFGGKGKGAYYLELDEKQEAKASQPSEEAAVPATETKAEPDVKQEAAVAPQSKTISPKSVKSTTAKVEAAPVAVAKNLDSSELVKQAIAKMPKSRPSSQDSMGVVASDDLMPLPTPRRMPGPSLNVFKEMARQLKR